MIRKTTVEAEQAQMPHDYFARERLGWWSGEQNNAVINAKEWNACATKQPPIEGLLSYAVKFSPDGSTGTLAVCLKPKDGKPHIEVIESKSLSCGVVWFADWLEARKDKAAQITIDGMSMAQPLVDALISRRVPSSAIVKPKSGDVAVACSSLLNAILEQQVTHFDQGALNNSALKSKKRNIGSSGGWGFAGTDSTLIEACALAYWGAMNTKRNPGKKIRVGF